MNETGGKSHNQAMAVHQKNRQSLCRLRQCSINLPHVKVYNTMIYRPSGVGRHLVGLVVHSNPQNYLNTKYKCKI